jgi:Cu/Ag efflux pump CusA
METALKKKKFVMPDTYVIVFALIRSRFQSIRERVKIKILHIKTFQSLDRFALIGENTSVPDSVKILSLKNNA